MLRFIIGIRQKLIEQRKRHRKGKRIQNIAHKYRKTKKIYENEKMVQYAELIEIWNKEVYELYFTVKR
jgi:hypothetical protein